MSTSLLYHLWNIRGVKYLKTDYQNGGCLFHVEFTPDAFRCPHCQALRVKKKDASSGSSTHSPSGAVPSK